MDEELRKRRAEAMSLPETAEWDEIHRRQEGPLRQLGLSFITDWAFWDALLDEEYCKCCIGWEGLSPTATWIEIERHRWERRQTLDRFAEAVGLEAGASWSDINEHLNSLDESVRTELDRRYHAGEFGVHSDLQQEAMQ